MTGKAKWFGDAGETIEPPSIVKSNWILGRRWYICRPLSGKEWAAFDYATERKWTIFFPHYVKARKNGGGRHIGIKTAYLPGYFFATGDRLETTIYDLQSRLYFNKLLGSSDEPYQINDTDPVMHELFNRADCDGLVREPAQPLFTYGPGDELCVISGPFEGREGKVHELSKHQVKIWANVFDRPTLITIPHEMVKRKVVA